MDAARNRAKMLRYLEEHGVSDKDARPNRMSKKAKSGVEKTRKGQFRKVIDLHGMKSDDAEHALARTMLDCGKRGIRELLVIHGWGQHSDPGSGGVLKKMVRDNLDHRYSLAIAGYKTALPKDGGEGATLVMLK